MVTKLEHARAMKLMGAPLNTPVDTRPFSEQYTTHWAAMMNAHADFMATLTRFVEEGGQSADKWWSVRRRHVAHYTAVIRCIDFVDELAGNVGPDAGRVFKSEQDEHEHMLLTWFISERALPFLDFWTKKWPDKRTTTVPARVFQKGSLGIDEALKSRIKSHRLEAARKLHKRKLGPDHIRAEIVDDLDANAALLAEIDEKFRARRSSPIERALHVARRKELYELEHPKTVHGGDRKRLRRKKSRSQNENLKNFVDDAARKTGKGRSTIARDAARGNLDGIGDAIGTSLDKGEELDHLIRLPADRRDALIARAKGGEKVSAKTESKKVRRADREQQLAESTAAAAIAVGQRMSRSYRQEAEQERQRRDAERSALERDLALQRAREFGRDDLAELLEAGEISAGEAFFRLHARR